MYTMIVIDFNSMNKTIRYVEEFRKQCNNHDLIHFMIVDNSPKEQNADFLKLEYELKKIIEIDLYKINIYIKRNCKIYYCYANENLGYAKGNNLGARLSKIIWNDSYYIFSNNDLSLTSKFDAYIFDEIFKNNEDIAVIGPRIIGEDGKEQSPHKRVSAFSRLIAYYWFYRWPFRWKPDYDYDGCSKYCYRVMGCFMLVKAKCFELVGGFDPKTFLFAEEQILSERLKKKDYKTYFYNDWTLIHEHGASIRKNDSVLKSEQWAFDSICYYYRKYRNMSYVFMFFAKVNFILYKLIAIFIYKLKILLKEDNTFYVIRKDKRDERT